MLMVSRKLKWICVQTAAIALLGLTVALCAVARDFVVPKAQPAKTYPAHDAHPTDAVTVALDPYDMADKADIFSVHYNEEGLLPIFLVITNEGEQPIALAGMKAQLVTVNRTKMSPATVDDIYRRLSRPSTSTTPSPLPFPRKQVKGAVGKQALEEIQSAQFGARAVEPHTTQAGLLFFDVSGYSTPLAGQHLYPTVVRHSKRH